MQAQITPTHGHHYALWGGDSPNGNREVTGAIKFSKGHYTATDSWKSGESQGYTFSSPHKANGILKGEIPGTAKLSYLDFETSPRKQQTARAELLKTLKSLLTNRNSKDRKHSQAQHEEIHNGGDQRSPDVLTDSVNVDDGVMSEPCSSGQFANTPCTQKKRSKQAQLGLHTELSNLEHFVSEFVSESMKETEAERAEIEELKAAQVGSNGAPGE